MANRGGNQQSADNAIFRIPPYFYIHVLDQNTNVTRVEVGPKTFIRNEHERVVFGPERMVTVSPNHYCVIENPAVKNDKDEVLLDTHGQVRLLHGDQEVRLSQEPFPLYPGEVLRQVVTPLKTVHANSALRLKALLDFEIKEGVVKHAGEEWLFEGPGTYIPRKEVSVQETVSSVVIKPNQALRLRARRECTDRSNVNRVAGEEWIVKQSGSYLPGAYEEVVSVVNAYVLTEKIALHVRAAKSFKDDFGVERKTGEEWLITMSMTEAHIPNVYEEVVQVVDKITLNNRQYCIILDPYDDETNTNLLGRKRLVKGEKSFFLLPGESLERGIQDMYVLAEYEGLLVRAAEQFDDTVEKSIRQPGDRWMIRGPKEYVPSVHVEVVCKRMAIPLDENEGVYVRNIKSGRIRSIRGPTAYMLSEDEELWEKDLSPGVEELLGKDPLSDRSNYRGEASGKVRDRTRVVSFQVPHNAAVQIYDYKKKQARVIFGPDLVMLEPDEQFTRLSLSGGTPKQGNKIKSLALLLGPDFMTDRIRVETADHAQLELKLSYNWHFDVDRNAQGEIDNTVATKIFSVPDFVGDACKAVASRIRGAVAGVSFDDFHRHSAKLIRASVFGIDPTTEKVRDSLMFPANLLVISSVDIQEVQPVDQRTRDSLMKSVQLAIEITTSSQEATAKHEAERREQEARGRLERQKLTDEAEAEKSRRQLLELQADSASVEAAGQAKAEARSKADAAKIEAEAAVEQAKLRAEATRIEAEAELARLAEARASELQYQRELAEMEVEKKKKIADIDVDKFKNMVAALGTETIRSMATAGPDHQVRMLQSLGLHTALITDGSTPINLLQTANGLIGAGFTSGDKRNKKNTEPDIDSVDGESI